MRKIGMWILHHFVRVIWANLFGVIMWLRCLPRRSKALYKQRRKMWDCITDIDGLIDFIRNVYTYKFDGYKGIFDHNNYPLEFFTQFGDCDDVATYAKKKLRQIYGQELQYCEVRGFSNLGRKFLHYDCVYKLRTECDYRLFNYGNIQTASSLRGIDEVMRQLYSRRYELDHVTGWQCLWM